MATEADETVAEPIAPIERARLSALIATFFGNTLEWFDFVTYGILATYIARAFFRADNGDTALLETFAVFGVGFVLRPLGAIVIGWVGDSYGRKPAFLLTIVTMTAGTLMIAFLPTYAMIGMTAPLLLLLARLLQGFSAGGELGVAISFLSEWSPPGRRGFFSSFLSMTVALGSLLASGIAAILISFLRPEDMAAWGWRIPFLIGGLLGLIGRWMRASVDETPAYRQLQRTRPENSSAPIPRSDLVRGLLAFGLTIHWTVCFYMFLVYLPTYARVQAGIAPALAAWSNTICLLTIVILVPIVGLLSDRHGRRPFLVMSCSTIALMTLPALWLILATKSFAVIVPVQIVFGLAIALYSGPAPALMAELFPTQNRARLAATSYAFAAALFGGFAPFIADWLINVTGSPYAPALYVVSASLVSLLVVLRIPETAGKSFH
ncbi:MFS transporter, MHS family, proline/betaine transporter [Phyllobacterium sp. YR620]|uniref:MFS transporter n=1 Tax=Phyllobacterium sp. YR620 TaxID=1881066 RepID=UPI00088806CC|nr:MFS transporter [Phyllobacterium sp. YR620]SDP89061.1 MFS transporter, MHS family, proline/betaine transporter [Phyllobacterium sp. YR620]